MQEVDVMCQNTENKRKQIECDVGGYLAKNSMDALRHQKEARHPVDKMLCS